MGDRENFGFVVHTILVLHTQTPTTQGIVSPPHPHVTDSVFTDNTAAHDMYTCLKTQTYSYRIRSTLDHRVWSVFFRKWSVMNQADLYTFAASSVFSTGCFTRAVHIA